jgi:hypothetical protein
MGGMVNKGGPMVVQPQYINKPNQATQQVPTMRPGSTSNNIV